MKHSSKSIPCTFITRLKGTLRGKNTWMTKLTAPERDALFRFLDTGILGPIGPGMTSQRIIDLLGIPSRTSNPDANYSPYLIYLYGTWLELTFDDGVLVHISLRYKWQKWSHRRLKLGGIFVEPWTRAVASWNYLRFRSVFYNRGRSFRLMESDDGSLALNISEGGSIIFDHAKRMGLHSINYRTGKFWNRLNAQKLCKPFCKLQRLYSLPRKPG